MKVSVVIPVVRLDKSARCVKAVYENAGLPRKQYEIITQVDEQSIGCPKMVKILTRLTNYETVCFLGDDCIPQKDFLKNALEVMKTFPGKWGLVGLNDGSKHQFAPHWLAHKKLLKHLNGEFFHTGYRHCYCDVELTERCHYMGRYAFAENAKIIHANPFIDPKVRKDEYYEHAYSFAETDRELYLKRKKEGYK